MDTERYTQLVANLTIKFEKTYTPLCGSENYREMFRNYGKSLLYALINLVYKKTWNCQPDQASTCKIANMLSGKSEKLTK